MKVCITGDWHIDFSNRMEDLEQSLGNLVSEVTKIKPDYFIFLGDGYKSWKPIPLEMKIFHDAILTISRVAKKTLILVGNHDTAESEDFRGIHCFFELKTLCSLVEVIDVPNILLIGGFSCIFVPHIPKSKIPQGITYEDKFIEVVKNLVSEAKAETPKTRFVLFSHVYIKEAAIGSNDMILSDAKGVSVATIKKSGIDMGFFSDIHKAQSVDVNFYYPGSINRVNFGESEDSKGFIVWDTESRASSLGSVEFIDLHSRKMDEIILDLVNPGFIKTDDGSDTSKNPPVEKPLEYIYEALGVKDQMGYQFKDSIVKIKVICTKEQKAILEGADEKIATFLIDTIGIHSLKSISYEITDSVSVRNAEVNESLKPAEALNKWIGMQDYKEETGTQVRIAGEKIIKG